MHKCAYLHARVDFCHESFLSSLVFTRKTGRDAMADYVAISCVSISREIAEGGGVTGGKGVVAHAWNQWKKIGQVESTPPPKKVPAQVLITVKELTMPVVAAVSKTLPVSALLGTDIPEGERLLQLHSTPPCQEQALVVTRAQARQTREQQAEQAFWVKPKAVCEQPSMENQPSSH